MLFLMVMPLKQETTARSVECTSGRQAGRHRLASLESAVNFAFCLASSRHPNTDSHTLYRRAASSLLVKEQELLQFLQCDNVRRPADADIRCILAIFG